MKSDTSIHCVFFDLGHVLVHVDIDKFINHCTVKSDVSFTSWITGDRTNSGIVRDFNLGKITPNDFYHSIYKAYSLQMSYDEFVAAYCNIFTLNSMVVNCAKKLASKVKLSMISNTDTLHFSYITNTFEMMSLFEKPTTSFKEGLLKPDPAIYQIALDKMEVTPGQSVFIDDLAENVDGAKAVGMHGIHYCNDTDLIKELRKVGLEIG